MMRILVATHGNMAKGICSSYEMLAGSNDKIDYLTLSQDDTGQFKQKLAQKIEHESDDLLILCDIKGGSPYNECFAKYLENPQKIRVVSGLNLPMLLEVGLSLIGEPSLDQITDLAEKSGKNGVCVAEDTASSDQDIEF